MRDDEIPDVINVAWEQRDRMTSLTQGPVRVAVKQALQGLDEGTFRIAEKLDGTWQVHEWLKKAVLLSFRLNDSELIEGGPGGSIWWDKVPAKWVGWNTHRFESARYRAVPGSFVRFGSYIAPDAVVMPSFVNIGSYIGENTMIDIGAAIGSCAQIGARCHVSANVVIGGVLEPLQAAPVILEDHCFIGAGSVIAEGVIVEEGAIVSMGCAIGSSTKIIDRETGAITTGRVPSYAVVVPGSLPGKPLPSGAPAPSLACAVIVKRVDEQTRAKTSINELLRD